MRASFARPRLPQDRTYRLALIGSGACLAVYLIFRCFVAPSLVDLAVYRLEGDAIRNGMDLYGHLPTPHNLVATYPPFAAIVFVPFALTPWPLVEVLVTLANFALLFVVSLQSCRLAQVAAGRRVYVALVAAGVAVWAEPVFTTFRYGQINLLILALILWDFLRPETAKTRGIGIGIATALKVTPGLFIVYLILTRRFRMAAVAAGTFAATAVVSVAIVPSATVKFWTKLLYDNSRVGRLENAVNQSVRGVVVRITHTRDPGLAWLSLSVIALVIGVVCAVYVYRRLGDRWGVPACAVAGLLGAPISWSHHWVWCVPIAVLLWQDARRWFPLVAIFLTHAVWLVPHRAIPSRELTLAPWQVAVSAWYVLFGAFFLGLAVVRARRAPAGDDAPDRPRDRGVAWAARGARVRGR